MVLHVQVTPALLYGGGLAGGQSASPNMVQLPGLLSAARSWYRQKETAPSIVRPTPRWRPNPGAEDTLLQDQHVSQTPSQVHPW